jgi:hypothetical protein
MATAGAAAVRNAVCVTLTGVSDAWTVHLPHKHSAGRAHLNLSVRSRHLRLSKHVV